MGFYLRKSVSVGPFRFNLSKSGIGVSAGIRGLRVGTGPRGNYVHMGRHGLYYRATLPPSGRSAASSAPAPVAGPETAEDDLVEIESGEVSRMRDSSSERSLGLQLRLPAAQHIAIHAEAVCDLCHCAAVLDDLLRDESG